MDTSKKQNKKKKNREKQKRRNEQRRIVGGRVQAGMCEGQATAVPCHLPLPRVPGGQ